MHNKRSHSAAWIVLLMSGITSTSPAFGDTDGQITYVPDISVPLTTKAVRVHPPTLDLSSVTWTCDVRFEDRDGSLVVTQPPMGFAVPKPAGKILWSGKLGTEPQQFAFVTTNTKEELKDSTGKVIWSRETQPSLTLDFDQPGFVRLLDAAGKELGTAPIDHTVPPTFPAHHYREPFLGFTSEYDGIRVEKDTGREQTTLFSGSHLIWSGPNPPNDGIRYGRSADSPIGGIPTSWLPSGQTLTLEVTQQTGSIIVTDENHHFLEAVPSVTLRLTASSADESFRKTVKYRILSSLPVATTTQIDVNAPGLIYVRYRTPDGDWAGEEAVHALNAVWHYKTAHVSGSQPGLDLWAAYFDKSGKRVGTSHDGFRTFPQ